MSHDDLQALWALLTAYIAESDWSVDSQAHKAVAEARLQVEIDLKLLYKARPAR